MSELLQFLSSGLTVGAVVSFGGVRKQLEAAKLEQCNTAALPAQQVANR